MKISKEDNILTINKKMINLLINDRFIVFMDKNLLKDFSSNRFINIFVIFSLL